MAVFGPHLRDPFAANLTCKKCNGSHYRFPCDVTNQNKKFTNPSEVLVLTHVRPSNIFTFCNVSARQGSSLSNRARLNFQVYALLDMRNRLAWHPLKCSIIAVFSIQQALRGVLFVVFRQRRGLYTKQPLERHVSQQGVKTSTDHCIVY